MSFRQQVNEFVSQFIDGIAVCEICKPSGRPKWVWSASKQWVPCWNCSGGEKVPLAVPPIIEATSKVVPFQTVSTWKPPSQRAEGPKSVVDIFSYVNNEYSPRHRTKSEMKYICEKCKQRSFVMRPQQLCTHYGCTGTLKEQLEVHIRAIPHGSQANILLFFHLLQAIDVEWKNPKKCGKCHGMVIKCPTLNTEDMQNLAKQCGLKKLKFKKVLETCEGTAGVVL